MLNALWTGFFLVAIAAAWLQFLFGGDSAIFSRLLDALFVQSKLAFEVALGLTGVLAFWLGMLRVAEKGGVIQLITRAVTPLFRRLMPEVPPEHPAVGAIVMNLSANVLGLDNAATPLGIQAMRELQSLNPRPDTASDAQILFFVLNASSVTLFPVTLLAWRAQLGAANPADVFLPILLATSCSTLTGLLAVASLQRIRLRDPVVLAYLGGFALVAGGLAFYLAGFGQAEMQVQSALISHSLLLSLIAAFLLAAWRRRINVHEAFIEGAKEGFQTAVTIIPHLVAMLAAVGVLRASGVLDGLLEGIRSGVEFFGWDSRFVDALPTALVKPFSGSGARAMMLDAMKTFGADSFAGRLSVIIQGSTETTFYVLAVYFGAVGIKNVRHAVGCGLLADFAGVVAAILITAWFFG
ncbi:MAG TPA: nucleoside recognition domain-containing protein [Methylococcaceae bacterium]|nr:nucleoside recognition domain-containing protein [Methylococcaceae bacterium]